MNTKSLQSPSSWPCLTDTSPAAVLERALRSGRLLARVAVSAPDCPTCDPGGEGREVGSEAHRDIELALKLLPALRQVSKVLEPFARMHRTGADPKELVLRCGASSDATYLSAGDFRAAFDLLRSLDPAFKESVSEDDRYAAGESDGA